MFFFQPLDQFKILIYPTNFFFDLFNNQEWIYISNLNEIYLLYFNLFTTNFTFSILVTNLIYVFMFIFFVNNKRLLFNIHFFSIFLEKLYIIFYNLTTSTVENSIYFPILFHIFIFIILNNLLGLLPFGFTTTSFIIETFCFSFGCFIAIIIIGLKKHKIKFFSIFIPKNVPTFLIPFLILIELISYLSRPFSLGIRLFANMMSGHSLLNILTGFLLSISKKSVIISIMPLIIIILIFFLELGVTFLQGYVFIILICIYLQESFFLHDHETIVTKNSKYKAWGYYHYIRKENYKKKFLSKKKNKL